MVSLRRHLVPNPVSPSRTDPGPKCHPCPSLHTRYDQRGNRTARFQWDAALDDADSDGEIDDAEATASGTVQRIIPAN